MIYNKINLFSKDIKMFNNVTGVYIININTEFYIGSSLNIKNRLFTHRQRLKNNKHHNVIIRNYYNKYGKDKCFVALLEKCEISELLIKEKKWIDLLNPKLNVEKDPTKQQGSYKSKIVYQYNKNGTFIKEHKSTASAERSLGKNSNSISICAKGTGAYKSAYGYLWSYKKVSIMSYTNNSDKSKIKSVLKLDLQDNIIDEYESIANAVRNTPNTFSFASACANISACCRNKTKQTLGFNWKYK